MITSLLWLVKSRPTDADEASRLHVVVGASIAAEMMQTHTEIPQHTSSMQTSFFLAHIRLLDHTSTTPYHRNARQLLLVENVDGVEPRRNASHAVRWVAYGFDPLNFDRYKGQIRVYVASSTSVYVVLVPTYIVRVS